MGGVIAMFVPSGLLSLAWTLHLKRFWKVITLVGLCISLSIGGFTLMLSMSRGAWVALAAGLLAWAGFAMLNRITIRLNWDRKIVDRFLGIGLVAGGVLVIIMAWAFAPQILKLFPPLGDTATAGQAGFGRYELMKASTQLISDYPLTGIGLGTFPMVFSTYAILIQVPYIVHAHNLYLNLAISQGLPGLATWLLVLAGTLVIAWQLRNKPKWPIAAAGVMLVVMLVHGLVDDPLYGSRAVLSWWVPAGLLAAQAQVIAGEDRRALKWLEFGLAVGVAGMLLVLLVGMLTVPAWRAQAIANLGAVYQTRIELGNYQPDHWDTKTLDQVRRQADLSQATGAFEQALAVDPNQRTALLRLAEIDLSRQAYGAALTKLQSVYKMGSTDPVTRMLLGDALTAIGDPQGAADLVRGLPFAAGRMQFQSWYRYHLDGDLLREQWALQVAKLIQ